MKKSESGRYFFFLILTFHKAEQSCYIVLKPKGPLTEHMNGASQPSKSAPHAVPRCSVFFSCAPVHSPPGTENHHLPQAFLSENSPK
ncbi:hypothetical protein CB1_047321001 [Camelus ferus]|nr:hypothetical protein CB1_047321001 [Camelus ferus]